MTPLPPNCRTASTNTPAFPPSLANTTGGKRLDAAITAIRPRHRPARHDQLFPSQIFEQHGGRHEDDGRDDRDHLPGIAMECHLENPQEEATGQH